MSNEIFQAFRSRLGRNALLNLAGLAVPLAVAALVLPLLTHSLGPARFGLLGVSWAFLEYLTLFDVGLGRATVRYVADSMARCTRDESQITWVSLSVQLAIGCCAAVALIAFAPTLARHVFRVDPSLVDEASQLFKVVALNLPIVLALTTFRGVLEGAQKFTLSNAIKIPASAGSIVIPAVLARMGHSLPDMLMWVLVWRILATVATLIAITRVIPEFRVEPPRDWRRLRSLISFGGWVAVSGVISPMLIYFDRFALGARSGLTAVGYYTAPYEGITRLLMIPNSLIGALFPLLTGLGVVAASARIDRLFASSMRALVLMMSVPAALALVFAPVILRVWMGPVYAEQGAMALRILSVGVLVNAMAHIPYTFLEAAGRPDVPAKFHMLELVIYLPFAWYLVGAYGINGAAMAWTARVTLDTTLLLVAANRIVPVSLRRVVWLERVAQAVV
ncbi:MAG: flippase [Gemmatimonadota bacterium]|nr:flippase [Gemmatimonadota bacterium]